ncbi:asparaginyl/glutamyl-tRNA amidotransferase subunit C [Microgenomates group bacterium RBG_19FT_COMBO_39_10]|nr:MAG: asparaginyl/glutamyl-tRNA amidotransferase subunit C [Microgenomates group bacterium RBG_19FT_COMBO_39_10]
MNKKTVQHIALLANLKLSNKEIEKFQKQLTEILDYVGQLNKVKTKEIKPTSQVTGLENVFRKDEPGPSLSSQDVLANAKKTDKGMFKIKAIFEQWS